MITGPAHLGEISVDSGEISPKWDENFPYERSSHLTGLEFLFIDQSKINYLITWCKQTFIPAEWDEKFPIWTRDKNHPT